MRSLELALRMTVLEALIKESRTVPELKVLRRRSGKLARPWSLSELTFKRNLPARTHLRYVEVPVYPHVSPLAYPSTLT